MNVCNQSLQAACNQACPPGLRTAENLLVCVNPERKIMVATLLQNSTTAAGGGGCHEM